jgi:hypothetical protein
MKQSWPSFRYYIDSFLEEIKKTTKQKPSEHLRSNGRDFSRGSIICWVTRWRSWLRHCATSRKVAVSIPDDGTGICH